MKRISCKDGMGLQFNFFLFFPSFKDECVKTPPSTGEVSKLVETLQRLTFRKRRGNYFIFF